MELQILHKIYMFPKLCVNMVLELYLINTNQDLKGHKLYHNSSKSEYLEQKVERVEINLMPEGDPGERIKIQERYEFLKNMYRKPKDYIKHHIIEPLKRQEWLQHYILKPLKRYKTKTLAKLQNKNFKALKAASLIAKVNVNYSSGLSAKEAKKIYRKIARKEIIKNSIILGTNLLLIGAFWTPVLWWIQGSSYFFGAIGLHAARNIKTILKGRKGVDYVANDQISILEDILHKNTTTDKLNNPDLEEFYRTYCPKD